MSERGMEKEGKERLKTDLDLHAQMGEGQRAREEMENTWMNIARFRFSAG